MRRRTILISALAIAVVLATIGGVAYVPHTRAQADGGAYPGLDGPVSVVCPGPAYITTRAKGFPGIRPRNDCTPSFTQQDVRDYVAHGPFLDGIQVTGQPTVTRLVFLTISDLGRAERQGVGVYGKYPPDMLVCYVGLSGTFTFSSGLGPLHTRAPLSSCSMRTAATSS
jgi:hypothetical protein